MHKILIVMLVSITITACGARVADPYERDKAPADRGTYSGLEGMKQQKKDQDTLTKEANKLKCQDARLDLVEAEGEGDINMIRQVKARVQRLCVTER